MYYLGVASLLMVILKKHLNSADVNSMAQQMRARVTVLLSLLSISAGAITALRLTWAFMCTDHIKHALVLHNA